MSRYHFNNCKKYIQEHSLWYLQSLKNIYNNTYETNWN
jgi:hypothetical protein